MAEFTERFGGVADGAEVTTSNTGLTSVTPAATWYGRAANKIGTAAAAATVSPNVSCNVNTTWTARAVTYADILLRLSDVNPSGTGWNVAAYLSNATTYQARIRILTAGTVALYDDGSATVVATSTTVLTDATPFRLQWKVDATGGTQTLRIFTGASYLTSGVPTETISGTYSGVNTDRLRVGNITGFSTQQSLVVGHIKWHDTTWPDPEPAPVVAATAFPLHYDGTAWH